MPKTNLWKILKQNIYKNQLLKTRIKMLWTSFFWSNVKWFSIYFSFMNVASYLLLWTGFYIFDETVSPLMQGKLVPKLIHGPFLTPSVRNGPNLQSNLFQEYTSLNPRRVEQNYTMYL